MHMLLVHTNFDELDLVTLLDLQAHLFEHCINLFVEHNSSILRWKHQVVEQNANVMTFVDVLTHPGILRRRAAGNVPKRDSTRHDEPLEGWKQ